MSEQFPGCLLIVTVEVDPAVEAEHLVRHGAIFPAHRVCCKVRTH